MKKLNNNFTVVYGEALQHVLAYGSKQFNERTNTEIRSWHGYSFRWDMNYVPLSMQRKMFLGTMAAEVAWMLSGDTSIHWLKKYTSIWDAFADDKEQIPTAYGHRWRKSFGVDQIQNIIDKLKADPSSRQQVLMSWDPRADNVVAASNVPCPYTAVINIIDNKLNIHLTLRSNDVFFGLPYDVGMYTMLGQAFAKELDVEVGEMFYSIAHMHIYSNQYNAATEVAASGVAGQAFKLNHGCSIVDIISDKSHFVEHVRELYKELNYEPRKLKAELPKVAV